MDITPITHEMVDAVNRGECPHRWFWWSWRAYRKQQPEHVIFYEQRCSLCGCAMAGYHDDDMVGGPERFWLVDDWPGGARREVTAEEFAAWERGTMPN